MNQALCVEKARTITCKAALNGFKPLAEFNNHFKKVVSSYNTAANGIQTHTLYNYQLFMVVDTGNPAIICKKLIQIDTKLQ